MQQHTRLLAALLLALLAQAATSKERDCAHQLQLDDAAEAECLRYMCRAPRLVMQDGRQSTGVGRLYTNMHALSRHTRGREHSVRHTVRTPEQMRHVRWQPTLTGVVRQVGQQGARWEQQLPAGKDRGRHICMCMGSQQHATKQGAIAGPALSTTHVFSNTATIQVTSLIETCQAQHVRQAVDTFRARHTSTALRNTPL
jgi:hypothetical protein